MGVTLCVVSLKCLSNRVTRWHVLLRFFSFFPFLHDNFHICIQSNLSKIFGTANTACDVTVILSRFLFSSEVVSHTAFGNASHSHSWVYSLVSSEGKNVTACSMRQVIKSDLYFLRPICGNLVIFSPPQHHDSSRKSACFAKCSF